MIIEGNFKYNNNTYDRQINPSHWKYSATILGLVRYFDFHKLPYFIEGRNLYYNFSYIDNNKGNLDKYYDYIEHKYSEFFLHTKILNKESQSQEEIRDNLKEISYLKDLIKSFNWNRDKEKILLNLENIIKENRDSILEKTYINNPFGYSNYLQRSCFRKSQNKSCRILDYYVDKNRKGRAASFGFNMKSYIYEDYLEYDYIPFGFTYGFSSGIINCNYDIETLLYVNNQINDYLRKNSIKNFEFIFLSKLLNIIPCPAEVIIKEDKYNAFIYREKPQSIFEYILNNKLNEIDKLFEGNLASIAIETECIKNIINLIDLDSLINRLLKLNYFSKTMEKLIKINTKLYQELDRLKFKNNSEIDDYINSTNIIYQALIKIAETGDSTIKYTRLRDKCLKSIDKNDFQTLFEEMLTLSSKTGLPFDFMKYITNQENFIKNKNIAFSIARTIIYFLMKKKGTTNEK